MCTRAQIMERKMGRAQRAHTHTHNLFSSPETKEMLGNAEKKVFTEIARKRETSEERKSRMLKC